MSDRILRLPEVKDRIGLGRSSIYENIANGSFPKAVKLGPRASGWLESEIAAWIDERKEQRDRNGND